MTRFGPNQQHCLRSSAASGPGWAGVPVIMVVTQYGAIIDEPVPNGRYLDRREVYLILHDLEGQGLVRREEGCFVITDKGRERLREIDHG